MPFHRAGGTAWQITLPSFRHHDVLKREHPSGAGHSGTPNSQEPRTAAPTASAPPNGNTRKRAIAVFRGVQ